MEYVITLNSFFILSVCATCEARTATFNNDPDHTIMFPSINIRYVFVYFSSIVQSQMDNVLSL